MNFGELNQRIKIYCLRVETSELDEDQPRPHLLNTVWAKVEPRTGSLMSGRPAETMLSKTTHVITTRYESLKNVDVGCYIVWADLNGKEHRFDIDYILPPVRGKPFSTVYVQEVE